MDHLDPALVKPLDFVFSTIERALLLGILFWVGMILYLHPQRTASESFEVFLGGILVLAAIALMGFVLVDSWKTLRLLGLPRYVLVAAGFFMLVLVSALVSVTIRTQPIPTEDILFSPPDR